MPRLRGGSVTAAAPAAALSVPAHDIGLAMIYHARIGDAPGAVGPGLDAPRTTAVLLRHCASTLPPGAVFRLEGQDG